MSNVWMPLYVADYLADTTHLSAAEHGAYLLLIMAYWQSGRPLPDDDAKLARVARMQPKEWRAARSTLLDFFTVEDGEWRHGRVDEELTKAERMMDQRRAAGRASAERRGQRKSNERSTSVADPLERRGQRKGNQSQSPSPEEEDTQRVTTAGATHARWPVAVNPEPWAALEAETRGLSAARVPEVWQSWRDHRMANGITPADPVADWRRWCGNELKRDRCAPFPRGQQVNAQQPAESLADRARRIAEMTEQRMAAEGKR